MNKIVTILVMVLFSIQGVFSADPPPPPGPPPPPPTPIDGSLAALFLLAIFLGYYLSKTYINTNKSSI